MPTLEDDNLVFRFPQIEDGASLTVSFQRTLRIPDSDRTYPLPPGLGGFPIRHVEDYVAGLSPETVSRGGVIVPIWQAEALWLHFQNNGPDWNLDFPFAIKVAAGKINAVTGGPWSSGLHNNPQDYMVSPQQPWLDGFAVEQGVTRQFVAMPLGDGYSVEEQLTGEAEWGGLQISVIPLRAELWKLKRRAWEEEQRQRREESAITENELDDLVCYSMSDQMGLAAGGRMRQVIHPDQFSIDDWDVAAADRVFVSLVHAKDWKRITGEAAPNEPPTAKAYSDAGLPWFETYGKDQPALPGSARLAGVKSVAELFKKMTGTILPNSQDLETGTVKTLSLGAKAPREVRKSSGWEI